MDDWWPSTITSRVIGTWFESYFIFAYRKMCHSGLLTVTALKKRHLNIKEIKITGKGGEGAIAEWSKALLN